MTKSHFRINIITILFLSLILYNTSLFSQSQDIQDYHFELPDTSWVVADWAPGMHMDVMPVKVEAPGYYRMFINILYDSGNEQLNESCYFTLASADSTPFDNNAGPYKIVEDDGDTTKHHLAWRDAGLFRFDTEETMVKLHHYAAIMDQYPEFLNGPIVLAESIKLPDSLKLIAEPQINGSIELQAITPRIETVDNEERKIAYPGETVNYKLIIRNEDYNTIRNAKVENSIPTYLQVSQLSLQPVNQTTEKLTWNLPEITSLDSFSITYKAIVTEEVPIGFLKIQNNAELIVAHDTDETDNQTSISIYSYVAPPVDGAIKIHAVTQHSNTINDEIQLIAFPGETINYEIVINNLLESDITLAKVINKFPSCLQMTQFSYQPTEQNENSITWDLPDIANQDSFVISFSAILSAEMPIGMTEIFTEADLIISNDIDTTNNHGTSLVYSYVEPPVDGAIFIYSTTPDIGTFDDGKKKITYPGETVNYRLCIKNIFENVINYARIINNLPSLIEETTQFSYNPIEKTNGTITWEIQNLAPQDSFIINYVAILPEEMPTGLITLTNEAELLISGDIDTTNNFGNTIVFSLADENGHKPDFTPQIQTNPVSIDVTDSTKISILLPINTMDWDLWVHYPNGEIDSSFADDFISSNQLSPSVWHDIEEMYKPGLLVSTQKEEQLIFEIHCTNATGIKTSARTTILVQSSNYLVLDRNVFRPDFEDDLDIMFKLSSRRIATLNIYDISGHLIVKLTENEYQGGWNTFPWNGIISDGKMIGSGVYIVTLHSGEFKSWKKFIVVR